MALDAMRKAYAIDEVREMIDLQDKALRDEATVVEHAKEQGIEQGRREGALDIARKMLANGMDRATVLSITGLRPDELPA